MKGLKYALIGVGFGIILVKSQAVSWFRIQEMFRLQAFHMYGLIGSAVVVGALSVLAIRRFRIMSVEGDPIIIQKKKFHWGNVIGGLIFGLGWAITGACPGPLFAEVGGGFIIMLLTLASAVGGTWVYGWVRGKLPH